MKYLIKETSTATEKNKNFCGETQIWFIGKGDHFERALNGNTSPSYYVKSYAYTSEGRARSALNSIGKSIEKVGPDCNWINEFEIIEVNC